MKTVKEVSRITGVSVRTLHHYDAIGLLRPTKITDAGYRLYDDTALQRLQAILLFRELEFPLKEIKEILDRPNFNPTDALADQIRLLELRKQHLDDLISHAREIQHTGVISMNFKPFDTTELETYAAEAKAKWGNTEVYQEYEKKTEGQTQEQQLADGAGLMAIFAEFGSIRHANLRWRENWMRDVIRYTVENDIPFSSWNYLSTPYDCNRFSLVTDDERKIISEEILRLIQGKV